MHWVESNLGCVHMSIVNAKNVVCANQHFYRGVELLNMTPLPKVSRTVLAFAEHVIRILKRKTMSSIFIFKIFLYFGSTINKNTNLVKDLFMMIE